MIGQHIYSRCLEGYFSRTAMSADSTTVTISSNMFARKEQAEKIARICEKIGALEDVRPVPALVHGAYRGVLKIKNLNRQISVVCRSYRLRSETGNGQGFSGGGESRDFTYSSSYLLTGEEKTQFFENPQYFLNLQDFESYPSVMNRIQEARRKTGNGRIEANSEYSLFRSPCKQIPMGIFEKAGFTEKLFADYICSILERIAYAAYAGHEKGKVLVILPKQFNPTWETAGGNVYAEELLAATYKILPEFVRSHLNATTGGMDNPEAYVLEDYQLVFMEKGQIRDWKRIDYSVIDLEKQESYVTEGLDTSYGQFLWRYAEDEEVRNDFTENYCDLFGKERVEAGNNYPEKFAYALKLWKEEHEGFTDTAQRSRFIRQLIHFSDESWTKRSISLVKNALLPEQEESIHEGALEQDLLKLIKKENCPEELQELIIEILKDNVLEGIAEKATMQWCFDRFLMNRNEAFAFWNGLKMQLEKEEVTFYPGRIWELAFFAFAIDGQFLEKEWKPVYENLVQRFATDFAQSVFAMMQSFFQEWLETMETDGRRMQFIRQAIALSVKANFQFGNPYYQPELTEIRRIMEILEEDGMYRISAEILFEKYQIESEKKLFFVRELNRAEQWKILLIWMITGRKDCLLETAFLKFCVERKELLPVLNGFEWKNKRELEKTVFGYFVLIKHELEGRTYEEDNLLKIWCRVYKNEIQEIQQILQKANFVHQLNKCFTEEIIRLDFACLHNLKKEEVLFLKEMGVVEAHKEWKCLDVMYEFFQLKNTTVSEEFVRIRTKMIKETNISAKKEYLYLLGKRRKELVLSGEAERDAEELVYNMILLEEQMRCEFTQQAECILDKMAKRIFVAGCTEAEVLLTAFRLLYVIGCYEYEQENGVYDCRVIRDNLVAYILISARNDPEQFCDKRIVRAFRWLSDGYKNRLVQIGLKTYLNELPKEWKNEFGLSRFKTSSESKSWLKKLIKK